MVTLPNGEGFRAYYRGLPELSPAGVESEVTAYVESVDGIHWTKPENNIVLRDAAPVTHNFTIYYDQKSGIPVAEKWKGIGGTDSSGLIRYVSSDGIEWHKFAEGEPMLPARLGNRYDSQNLVFWSEAEQLYLCYYRSSNRELDPVNGVRWISRATSPDFVEWTDDGPMSFRNADGSEASGEHLYTNQTGANLRAPHIYVAIAARFWPGRQVVNEEEAKTIGVDPGFFHDISDGVLMTSRGGMVYDRTFLESFVRPGPGLENWTSRTNYPAMNVIQTGAAEMSFFVQREYGQPNHHLTRFSLRLDGFAALHADYTGGEMVTKPFQFSGEELEINYATSAAGGIRFELQDETGTAIPGYTLEDSREIIGDQISRIVSWKCGSSVADLAGKTVRLRVVLKDADLFAIRFR